MPTYTIKEQNISAKVQSVAGAVDVDVFDAAYARFKIKDVRPEYVSEQNKRSLVTTTLDAFPSVIGKQFMRLTFKVEAKGSGTAGTAPAIGALLRGCGLAETVTPGTKVEYTPTSNVESLSMGYYLHGNCWTMYNAQGSFKFEGTNGGLGMFEFTFSGCIGSQEVLANLSPTYESTSPPPLLDGTVNVFGQADCPKSFAFDLGGNVAGIDCIEATYGYDGFRTTSRESTLAIDPLKELLSDFHPIHRLRTGTLGPVSIQWGQTSGNILKLAADNAQITDVQFADRDEISVWGLTCLLPRNESGSTTPFTWTFM